MISMLSTEDASLYENTCKVIDGKKIIKYLCYNRAEAVEFMVCLQLLHSESYWVNEKLREQLKPRVKNLITLLFERLEDTKDELNDKEYLSFCSSFKNFHEYIQKM